MRQQSIGLKYSVFMLLLALTALVVSGCDNRGDAADDTAQAQETPVEESAAAQAAPEPPQPVCQNCGRVVSITPRTLEGSGSGVGAVAGAVIGGLLGNQVGGGSGKKVATAVGAVGGAYAGNEIEKRRKQQVYYDVLVELDNGGSQTVSVSDASALSLGTRVKVAGNDLQLL